MKLSKLKDKGTYLEQLVMFNEMDVEIKVINDGIDEDMFRLVVRQDDVKIETDINMFLLEGIADNIKEYIKILNKEID